MMATNKRTREDSEEFPNKTRKVTSSSGNITFAEEVERISFTEIGDVMLVSVHKKGTHYKWICPRKYLTDTSLYYGEVVWNPYNKAMLDFIELKTGKLVFRGEINPFDGNTYSDWIVDPQY